MTDEDRQTAADRRAQVARKRRDLAALLPIAGVIIFASPLISAGTGGEDSALPAAVLYVFAGWAALILGAWLMAQVLGGRE